MNVLENELKLEEGCIKKIEIEKKNLQKILEDETLEEEKKKEKYVEILDNIVKNMFTLFKALNDNREPTSVIKQSVEDIKTQKQMMVARFNQEKNPKEQMEILKAIIRQISENVDLIEYSNAKIINEKEKPIESREPMVVIPQNDILVEKIENIEKLMEVGGFDKFETFQEHLASSGKEIQEIRDNWQNEFLNWRNIVFEERRDDVKKYDEMIKTAFDTSNESIKNTTEKVETIFEKIQGLMSFEGGKQVVIYSSGVAALVNLILLIGIIIIK